MEELPIADWRLPIVERQKWVPSPERAAQLDLLAYGPVSGILRHKPILRRRKTRLARANQRGRL
jgi:hypothetical protein